MLPVLAVLAVGLGLPPGGRVGVGTRTVLSLGETEISVKFSEILLMGATGFGLLLWRQQNFPTLQVNPTYLASGTGTSQCWSGLAQPQDLGSTVAMRFLIL